MLVAQEFADPLFELDRQRSVPDQCRGAGAVNSELAHRLDSGMQDARVGIEAEIVLAGEIDALEEFPLVGTLSAPIVGTVLGCSAQRPQPGRAAKLLPLEKGANALKQVRSRQMPEIAHAPAERVKAWGFTGKVTHFGTYPLVSTGTLTANRITIAFAPWLTGVKLYLFDQLLKRHRLGLEVDAANLDTFYAIALQRVRRQGNYRDVRRP